MKQLRILFIIVSLLCGLPMMGQTKEKTLEYGGWVEDFITHTAITDAKLTLLNDKGEVVKETVSDERNEQKNGGFTFIVANQSKSTPATVFAAISAFLIEPTSNASCC